MKLMDEIDEIKKWEEKIKRKLVCKANKYKYDFQQYETIRTFGDSIYNGKTSRDEAEMDHTNLLDIWKILMIDLDQKQQKVKIEKEILIKVHMLFMKVEINS